MALAASDFIEPAGELSSDLFPGVDLTTFVTGWLADAATRTTDEAAQAAWVYHRAFTSIANRLSGGATSVKEGGVTVTVGGHQAEYWLDRAASKRNEYATATGATPTPILTPVGYA